MNKYSKDEKVTMVMWYQKSNSLRQVRDMFAVNYPDRPIPCPKTILNIFNKFKANGCVLNSHKKRKRLTHVLTEHMKQNILCYVEERPVGSLTNVAGHFGISYSSVYKTLKEFKYKPYKIQNHQELFETDKIMRTDFCEVMFNMLNENEEILNKIIFTDEATFTLNGEVNSQNFRFVPYIHLLKKY